MTVTVSQGHSRLPYTTSKSGVLQMTRSMACELGPKRIRVNSISPGYFYTPYARLVITLLEVSKLTVDYVRMTSHFLDPNPDLLDLSASENPMGRIGRPDELRGIVTWLTSDASTYCTGSE